LVHTAGPPENRWSARSICASAAATASCSGSDGREHGFHGEYREIGRPYRLVSTFVYEGAPEHETVETVTFETAGSGTLVTGRSVFPSFAARDLYARAAPERGLRESHQRLGEWRTAVHGKWRHDAQTG
jgi:uncharacterized protein YndB with AHSA1/START domain